MEGYEDFVMMKFAAGCEGEKSKRGSDKRAEGDETVRRVTNIVDIYTVRLCGMEPELPVMGT